MDDVEQATKPGGQREADDLGHDGQSLQYGLDPSGSFVPVRASVGRHGPGTLGFMWLDDLLAPLGGGGLIDRVDLVTIVHDRS